ncbi:MAG TPA: STAS domain-containing protein [Magnetospirillaceae bacterium]|nr:STAS domain-containing protein [Magnetospirillaceae bacterium]
MNFQLDENADGIYVRLSGDLNFSANNDFRSLLDKLSAAGGRTVTFDLANVARIDSVGLGLLYIAKEEVAGLGRIRLKSPQSGIMKMLELTEADGDFDIIP